MTLPKPRGGARKGTGPKTDKTRKIKRVLVGIYDDQHATLKELGGSSWVRSKLDQEMGQIENSSPVLPQATTKV